MRKLTDAEEGQIKDKKKQNFFDLSNYNIFTWLVDSFWQFLVHGTYYKTNQMKVINVHVYMLQ